MVIVDNNDNVNAKLFVAVTDGSEQEDKDQETMYWIYPLHFGIYEELRYYIPNHPRGRL